MTPPDTDGIPPTMYLKSGNNIVRGNTGVAFTSWIMLMLQLRDVGNIFASLGARNRASGDAKEQA